ncbi:MAG TPA: TylF/MycF/NovP-related O-methyltransferase [Chitinophagaceae bacterium]|nr:TylF/MycF/NovP-related O-methyltransferase [Chitinophagaceae bacterium]
MPPGLNSKEAKPVHDLQEVGMKILSLLQEYKELARLQRRMAKLFPLYKEQRQWLGRFREISRHIESAHNPSHILRFLLAMFELDPAMEGCIVEAGAYKGGSTAKISLVAHHIQREFVVFDSFQGLPENDEPHDKSLEGHSIRDWFSGGKFSGSLDEVKRNVEEYGNISVCHFIPGWFEETMPFFNRKIALAYLDVDLASSTRTCLKYLYPLLVPGGAIFSQDGDFPLVIDVFKDKEFWRKEVGCSTLPAIQNLGKKITIIEKIK